MKLGLILIALFTLISANARCDEEMLTAVFQFPPSGARALEPGYRKVSFGLSDLQQKRLFEISGGQVNFQNIYATSVHFSEVEDIAAANPYFRGALSPNVPPPGFLAPIDPELAGEWWIEKLNVAEAWKTTTGEGVTIADCDAGYYTQEPDLSPNLLIDQRYDLSDKHTPLVVDDGNFVFHGTAVAAIMAGALDGKGTNGIAYGAKLVPLQNYNYSDADDLDKEEATAQCILRAITLKGVRIIVLENQTSNGSSETFVGTRAAVRLALQAGIAIVSAGGNYQKELVEEAKDDTGSIIVGALGRDGNKASFSNFGKRIAVAAFGDQLKTLTGPNGVMGSFGGTSGATPQVAATVALMLQANPGLTPAQIKKILEETRIASTGTEGVGGLVNIPAAVKTAREARPNQAVMRRQASYRNAVTQILRQG